MSIIYAIIAKENTPLCDYTDCKGNFQQICISVLKSAQKDTKGTMKCADFFFHYWDIDGMTFICVCEEKYKAEHAFAFLESVKNEFLQTVSHAVIQSATSYSLNKQFQEKLKLKMEFYEKPPDSNSDEVERLKKALIDEKNIVLDATEVLQQRGNKIEVIVQKAEALSSESNNFYKSAKNVHKAERRKKILYTAGLILVILLVIYLICSFVCGWNFKDC